MNAGSLASGLAACFVQKRQLGVVALDARRRLPNEPLDRPAEVGLVEIAGLQALVAEVAAKLARIPLSQLQTWKLSVNQADAQHPQTRWSSSTSRATTGSHVIEP
jgi:hypothetical protein